MTFSVTIRTIILSFAFALLFLPFLTFAQSGNDCGFTRTLDLGVEGEDVRCLQKFLNSTGYTVAASGVGSAGHETIEFRSLTEAAVIRWQEAKGVSPTSGVFGPKSQAAYLLSKVAQLETKKTQSNIAAASTQIPQVAGVSTSESNISQSDLTKVFLQALDLIEEADDEVEHLIITGESYSDEMRNLNKAKRIFFKATTLYFEGSYADALEEIKTVINLAADAIDGVSSNNKKGSDNDSKEKKESKSNKNNAWDEVDDAWDEYDELKQEIEYAEEDSEDVEDAYDKLKEASKLLQKAEDEIDDEDYDAAIELADDAQDVLNKGMDSL